MICGCCLRLLCWSYCLGCSTLCLVNEGGHCVGEDWGVSGELFFYTVWWRVCEIVVLSVVYLECFSFCFLDIVYALFV